VHSHSQEREPPPHLPPRRLGPPPLPPHTPLIHPGLCWPADSAASPNLSPPVCSSSTRLPSLILSPSIPPRPSSDLRAHPYEGCLCVFVSRSAVVEAVDLILQRLLRLPGTRQLAAHRGGRRGNRGRGSGTERRQRVGFGRVKRVRTCEGHGQEGRSSETAERSGKGGRLLEKARRRCARRRDGTCSPRRRVKQGPLARISSGGW